MFSESPTEKLSLLSSNSVPLPELLVELDEQEQESIAGGESSLSDFEIQLLMLDMNSAMSIVGMQFIIHPDTATLP